MPFLFLLLFQRLLLALPLPTSAAVWALTALILLLLAAIVLPAGLLSGFLRWEPFPLWWPASLSVALGSFFAPAFAEEAIFRVLLLPHPFELPVAPDQVRWSVLGLALFVGYHPLKSWLLPPSQPRSALFRNPWFLANAALVGLACTAAYLISGSIWPPMLIHWTFVVVWLLLLGGARQMGMVT